MPKEIVFFVNLVNYMTLWLYKNEFKIVPIVDWVTELYVTLFTFEPITVLLFIVYKYCALFPATIEQVLVPKAIGL